MAKKKLNERRNYNLGSKDVITYKKSRIPRQIQFMILRGPGLDALEAIDENVEMKKIALRKRIKLKFMQARTIEEVIIHLKDANTWATGVIYNIGDLSDQDKLIKKTIDRLLIPVVEISSTGKILSIIDGFKKLSSE